MLLKIDVYPNTFSLSGSERKGKLKSPVPTLYASLRTSSSSSIVTVGRKECDIVFSADKSVSRQHLSVIVKSTMQETTTDDDIDGTASPEEAKTDEEIAACEEGDGLCVVIQDSSRFGTFVVQETDFQISANNDDDSATGDDDATDDEGQLTPSQSQNGFQLLSPVTRHLVKDPAKAKLKKIDPANQILLSHLSDSNNTCPRTIIQCGQNGSTIVLTRVSLNIAFSRTEKAVKDLWVKKRFPLFGAKCVEVLDTSLHCLVSKDRIANAKNMAAWSFRKPIVSAAYLDALWNRRDPAEKMPPFQNHLSVPGDKTTFWETDPNPHLWRSSTFLSYAPDDTESMCRSAGASIMKLYENTDFQESVASIQQKQSCFCLNSSAAKYSKYVKYLKKQKFPFVKQKTIASALSQQILLVDDKGNQITQINPSPPSPQSDSSEETQTQEFPPDGKSEANDRVRNLETQLTNDIAMGVTQATSDVGMEVEREAPGEAKEKRSKIQRKEATKESQGTKRTHEEHDEDEDNKDARHKRPKQPERPLSREEKKEDSLKLTSVRKPMAGQNQLSKTSNGWLVAAPRGEERAAYKKVIDEDLPSPIITEVVEGLVVAPKRQQRDLPSVRSGVKDFKGFRKNRVVSIGHESRIAMRSVLPKETDRQRELQEEEERLEEHMRQQEELFQQGEGRAGNSIRSHFAQTGAAVKQKRKRRAI